MRFLSWLLVLLPLIESSHFVLVLRFQNPPPMLVLFYNEREDDLSLRLGPFQPTKDQFVFLNSLPDFWTGYLESKNGSLTKVELTPDGNQQKKKIISSIKDNEGNELSLSYHVECEKNFYGPQCSVRCIPNQDGGNYTCSASGEPLCRPGWRGENCSIADEGCQKKPCLNGICHLNRAEGGFTCECDSGFGGRLCDRDLRTTSTKSISSSTVQTTKAPEQKKAKTTEVKPSPIIETAPITKSAVATSTQSSSKPSRATRTTTQTIEVNKTSEFDSATETTTEIIRTENNSGSKIEEKGIFFTYSELLAYVVVFLLIVIVVILCIYIWKTNKDHRRNPIETNSGSPCSPFDNNRSTIVSFDTSPRRYSYSPATLFRTISPSLPSLPPTSPPSRYMSQEDLTV